jgi:urea carboxylase
MCAQASALPRNTVTVLAGGLATTVQDYPGRRGYWHVGVPPSGPMDSLAFRLGNRLLENPEGTAGLEVTLLGPTLRFDDMAVICLAGADSGALLDGRPLAPYSPTKVAPGQTLKLNRVRGPGVRAYVLFSGGLKVPEYLGSRSTFTLGNFGGLEGRALAAGDVLRLGTRNSAGDACSAARELRALSPDLQPDLVREWHLRVLYGPHGAPDFLLPEDIDDFLSANWKVHHNSNRTGVRLIGPKPRWARRDGGDAGLHPSNIHDTPYAIGAIDFTGDMPIILGPDGPSLGGFVCPFVVIAADLWKLGQLAPGDSVRFTSLDEVEANEAEEAQDALIARLSEPEPARRIRLRRGAAAILAAHPKKGQQPQTVYRRQGDANILIEYGEMVLDLSLRLRVHALMLELERLSLPGIIDVTPGIRSLQVHFDTRGLPLRQLLRALQDADERLGELDQFKVPSRIVWLPLSFADPAVDETIARYMSSVRADAPWCPDNIDFIRRINGLASQEDVRRIVFDARYLVLGLGDVYLGAPVAVPLDPRHRLVTTKYNPARTWTPPNVVGIGGAYLCVYGMEGPGGYQLLGRTVQVWNSHGKTRDLSDGKPWLLRFFDQIRFFEVTHAELTDWRADFPDGRRSLRIETESFCFADYQRFLSAERESIESFQRARQSAFNAEREAWAVRKALTGSY